MERKQQEEEEEARQREDMNTSEDEEDTLEDLVKIVNYGNTVRSVQSKGEIAVFMNVVRMPVTVFACI